MSDVIAVFPIEREDSLICHGAALRKATRRVSQLYDAVLAPCGLKVSQHSILSHIARAGAVHDRPGPPAGVGSFGAGAQP